MCKCLQVLCDYRFLQDGRGLCWGNQGSSPDFFSWHLDSKVSESFQFPFLHLVSLFISSSLIQIIKISETLTQGSQKRANVQIFSTSQLTLLIYANRTVSALSRAYQCTVKCFVSVPLHYDIIDECLLFLLQHSGWSADKPRVTMLSVRHHLMVLKKPTNILEGANFTVLCLISVSCRGRTGIGLQGSRISAKCNLWHTIRTAYRCFVTRCFGMEYCWNNLLMW